jgi:putative Holliday junction resolvase
LNEKTPATTILAFDYGLSQIGLAVGNTQLNTSQPLTTIKAKDGIPKWDEVAALLEEWQPDQLLVGLPLNMDGSESDMCQRARKFAARLEGRFGAKVKMVDERLTSFAAKEILRDQGHAGNYKRQPADAMAAKLILETWLQSGPAPR